jgi:hypothetical protein
MSIVPANSAAPPAAMLNITEGRRRRKRRRERYEVFIGQNTKRMASD